MTRTIEEIRETYKDTRSEIDDAVASYHGYKKDSPFVKQLEDILFLLDHIAELQAANAALQAQVGALAKFEGWRDTKTFPRVEHSIPSAVHTETVDVLIIVRMYHTLIREGKIESYWQDDINRVENDRVLGWRYTPDESPTAESEE